MREVKFRAWNTVEEVWMYFDLSDAIGGRLTKYPLRLINKTEYTGLKDKNGVEIYEGDIVKEGSFYTYKIIWAESMAGFKKRPINQPKENRDELMNKSDTLEVIGNIYENKELLK